MLNGARDGGGGGARIQNHHVTGANQARSGGGDFQFFAPVQLFFFVQSGIAQRRRVDRQRAAVRALQAAHLVERFQILANGDQRSGKAAGQVFHDDSAVALRQFQDFSPPLFREHQLMTCFRFLTFCYYFVPEGDSLAQMQARSKDLCPVRRSFA